MLKLLLAILLIAATTQAQFNTAIPQKHTVVVGVKGVYIGGLTTPGNTDMYKNIPITAADTQMSYSLPTTSQTKFPVLSATERLLLNDTLLYLQNTREIMMLTIYKANDTSIHQSKLGRLTLDNELVGLNDPDNKSIRFDNVDTGYYWVELSHRNSLPVFQSRKFRANAEPTVWITYWSKSEYIYQDPNVANTPLYNISNGIDAMYTGDTYIKDFNTKIIDLHDIIKNMNGTVAGLHGYRLENVNSDTIVDNTDYEIVYGWWWYQSSSPIQPFTTVRGSRSPRTDASTFTVLPYTLTATEFTNPTPGILKFNVYLAMTGVWAASQLMLHLDTNTITGVNITTPLGIAIGNIAGGNTVRLGVYTPSPSGIVMDSNSPRLLCSVTLNTTVIDTLRWINPETYMSVIINGSYVETRDTDHHYVNYNLTGVSELNTDPIKYELLQNYPNPFNPTTKINYVLPTANIVKLNVYDTKGALIKTLVQGIKPAGLNIAEFDGSNIASGVYFYKLETGDFVETKRMLLIK